MLFYYYYLIFFCIVYERLQYPDPYYMMPTPPFFTLTNITKKIKRINKYIKKTKKRQMMVLRICKKD